MVSLWRVAMPFHIWEKRHWKTLPVNLETTSNTPTNWLIAPLLAKTGYAGMLAPFLTSQFARRNILRSGFGGCDRCLSTRIIPRRRGDSRARCNTPSLVHHNFFHRSQEQQHVCFLRAVPHQPQPPDFSLQRTDAPSDFNVELIEQLVTEFCVVHAGRNHHWSHRNQTLLGIFHQQIESHGFYAS